MSEEGASERLQPSLLDRLTDEHPDERVERRQDRVIDVRRLREIVLRDLIWLFNTTALESVQDLSAYPQARCSTINFGVPDIAGIASSPARALELQSELLSKVRDFEPRIIAETLLIEAIRPEKANNALATFDIRGELWAYPMPIDLYMRTELDITTGDLTIENRS